MTDTIRRGYRTLPVLAALIVLCLPATGLAQGGAQAEQDFAFAEGLYGQENYELALTKYTAFVKANPDHANMSLALFRAGECSFRLERYADAAPWFEQVITRFPDSAEAETAWLWLGDSRYKSGDYESAAAAYQGLIAKFPDGQLTTQASYWLAESYYHLARYDEAIPAYRDALKRKLSDNEAPYALYSIGLSHLQLQQYDEAVKQFSLALTRYPQSPVAAECQYLVGSAYHSQGKLPAAIEAYNKVLADHANSNFAIWAQAGLAGCHFQQAEYEQALAAYQTALADYPDSPAAEEAQLRVGDCLFHLERWPEAATAYAKAADRQDSKWAAEALYWLGVTHEKAGDADNALAAYARLTTQHPGSEHAVDAWGHVGTLKAAADDHDGAITAYEAAVAATADPARKQELQAALAWERYQRDGNEEAIGELEKVVRDDPTSTVGKRLAWRVGRAHYAAERWEPALGMFEQLLANDPDPARLDEARYLAATCQEKLGRSADAEKLYAQIVAGGATGEYAVYAAAALVGIHAGRGELDEAQKILTDLEHNGADGETVAFACYTVAEALRKADRAADAIGLYERAAAAAPDGTTAPHALLGLGWARLATEDARAGEAFEEVIKRFADSDAAKIALTGLLATGQAMFAREDYDGAALAYGRIIEGFPDSEAVDEARYGLGWVKLRQNKSDEALPLFEAAATAADDPAVEADARYQAARLLYAAKDFERAAAMLKPLREREGDGDRLAWAMALLGQTWISMKRYEPAAELFRETLARWPEHEVAAHAQLGLGRALRLLARYDEAIAALGKATGPAVAAQAQYELALALQGKGDTARAAEEFLKVAILHPDTQWAAPAQFAAGQCYERLGESDNAVKSYQVIINRYADQTEWADKAKARIEKLGQ